MRNIYSVRSTPGDPSLENGDPPLEIHPWSWDNEAFLDSSPNISIIHKIMLYHRSLQILNNQRIDISRHILIVFQFFDGFNQNRVKQWTKSKTYS